MITKRTAVTMQVQGHSDRSCCGQISAEPYSRGTVNLTFNAGRFGGTLLNVSLDELVEFVAAARVQCESEPWPR